MSLANEYTFQEGSESSLIDFIGTNNGTLGGTVLPTWFKELDLSKKRTGLSFNGGNNNTVGNYNRVEFTNTSFQYNVSSNWSMVCLFKSSKNDASVHTLFSLGNSTNAGEITFYLTALEKIEVYISSSAGSAYKYITSSNTYCDGKWHLVVVTYSSDKTLKLYIDGADQGASTNSGTISGNFYSGFEKVNIGATYAGTTNSYKKDLTGSIAYFANCNHTLTTAEVQRKTEEVLWQVYRNSDIPRTFIPGANTKGYYKFEGDITDSSGNGKKGTGAANLTYDFDYGILNQGVNFNGSSSKFTLPNTLLSNVATALTVSVNLKIDALSSAKYFIAPATNGLYFAYATIVAGKLGFGIYFSTAYRLRCLIDFSDLTGWHNFTYTWDTTQQNAKLYLDGVLVATSTDTQASAIDLSPYLGLGTYYGGASSWFDGQMDELIFEDRCWTAEETLVYVQKLFKKYLPPKNTVRDGLVNEYYLESPDGVSTVRDFVGTHNGTKGGASNPLSAIAPNGMNCSSFLGGNGVTAGNRQRIELTLSDFQYGYNSNFSIAVLFKSSKSDATNHDLFSIDNQAVNANQTIIILDSNEKIYVRILGDNTHYKSFTSTNTYCDGKWHLVVVTYTASGNILNLYIDGQLHNENAGSSGSLVGYNFYAATAKPTIGAGWANATSNYVYDLTGLVTYFANYNRELSVLEVDKMWRDLYLN